MTPLSYNTISRRVKRYYKDNYGHEVSPEQVRETNYYKGYMNFFEERGKPCDKRVSHCYLYKGEICYTIGKDYTDGARAALSDVFIQQGLGEKVEVVTISRKKYIELLQYKHLMVCG